MNAADFKTLVHDSLLAEIMAAGSRVIRTMTNYERVTDVWTDYDEAPSEWFYDYILWATDNITLPKIAFRHSPTNRAGNATQSRWRIMSNTGWGDHYQWKETLMHEVCHLMLAPERNGKSRRHTFHGARFKTVLCLMAKEVFDVDVDPSERRRAYDLDKLIIERMKAKDAEVIVAPAIASTIEPIEQLDIFTYPTRITPKRASKFQMTLGL